MAVPTVGTSGTGYDGGIAGPAGSIAGGGLFDEGGKEAGVAYWPLEKYKRSYKTYLTEKRNEIVEQQIARRYRHGSHWTSEQIDVFNKRKQPVVTFNRIGRKCDGIVGLVVKLKQEPRAYPTSPKHNEGADLATAALRSALDSTKWDAKTPVVAHAAAVDGIGGVEMVLDTDRYGYTVGLEPVDVEGFFYDPRSKKPDFSDARYMGMGKWIDAEVLKDQLPGHDEEIDASIGHGDELTSDADSDEIGGWSQTGRDFKNVRLVYICYMHQGGWCWALFTGAHVLMEGKSYFVDRNGKPICSFLMFSAAVDHDLDRYGFPRNLKSAQDEINWRRAKGLHELNTRRIFAEKGAFDDIEKARMEAVRPDGVVERNKGYEAEFDDARKEANIAGQLKFLEDARGEIENFGPNPALLGDQGIANRSGRAISLMQQAGVAELGPYMTGFRDWKLRVYEAVFFGIKKYWTNERWIRLTDDQGEMQLVQINAMQLDPMGMPQIVNSIGELDVDIVLDEGPDSTTMMQDFYETLAQVLPGIAPLLTPPQAQLVIGALIESAPTLQANFKRSFRQLSQQPPSPTQQAMEQLQVAGAQAQVKETESKAMLNMAKAQSEGIPDVSAPPQQMEFELPPQVQIEQAYATIDKTQADAVKARAQADAASAGIGKVQADATKSFAQADAEQRYARLAPFDLAQRAMDAAKDRDVERSKVMAQRAAQRSAAPNRS